MLVADQHKAATTDVAGRRVDDGEREGGGYGGVNSVAALFEDGDSCVSGIVLDGDDHGMLCADRSEAGLLGRGGREGRGEEEGGSGAAGPEGQGVGLLEVSLLRIHDETARSGRVHLMRRDLQARRGGKTGKPGRETR